MTKFAKWMYANKVTIVGLIALILYVLDEIFDFSNTLELSQEAYYGIASIIFIMVGWAIKGRGFESYDQFKEVVAKQKQLKQAKTLQQKVDVMTEMILDDKKPDEKTES